MRRMGRDITSEGIMFTKEKLYKVLGNLVNVLTYLIDTAVTEHTKLIITVEENGTVTLKSVQLSNEDGKNVKRTHIIQQGKDFVGEHSRTDRIS